MDFLLNSSCLPTVYGKYFFHHGQQSLQISLIYALAFDEKIQQEMSIKD